MPSELENFIRILAQANISLTSAASVATEAQLAMGRLDAQYKKVSNTLKLVEWQYKSVTDKIDAANTKLKTDPYAYKKYEMESWESRKASLEARKGDLTARQEELFRQRNKIYQAAPEPRDVTKLQGLYERKAGLLTRAGTASEAGDVQAFEKLGRELKIVDKLIESAEKKLQGYLTTLQRVKAESKSTSTADLGEALFPRAAPGKEDTDTKISEAQRRKMEEERILAEQRMATYNQQKYTALRETVEAPERGYSGRDIRRIRQVGLEGVEKWEFAKRGIDGVNRSLDVFVDKHGKVLPSMSRQFSTFASSIARDFRELAKWTIAIGLIYGPMRKIQELMGTMIENEVKLADASIVLSDATLSMGQIFDIVNESADAMGENVADVISNFSQAYQATGGMGNAMQRTAAATTLMNDALVLSKLSSLSASESIDILAAALRQTGQGLDTAGKNLEGEGSLLDKWVATTKVANVSLDTLATGFSVLGEAANAAGLSDEELNATLAVTSEVMGVTGREAANMARSFVAGFQSDKAVAALEAIGIATKDSEGNMRSFLSLQRDLYNAKITGIIDPATYSKLTLAIGGGTRRQAAVAGFIENAPRIQEVVNGQMGAAGAANAALAKQLETVQTALTRLNNAFQSIAQTLGGEGGLLLMFRSLLDVITVITKVADGLFASLGKAGPLLVTTLAAAAIMRQQGPSWKGDIGRQITDRSQTFFGAMGANENVARRRSQFWGDVWMGGTERAGAPMLTRNMSLSRFTGIAGSAALMGFAAAVPNFMNQSSGADQYGALKGSANLIGASIGAAAGSALMGNPMIGAALGSSIAESFVNDATRELSLSKIGGVIVDKTSEEADNASMQVRERLAGTGVGGLLRQWFASALVSPFGTGAIKSAIETSVAPKGQKTTIDTVESLLMKWLSPEKKQAFNEWYEGAVRRGEIKIENPEARGFETAIQGEQGANAALLASLRKGRGEQYMNELLAGKLTPTAYNQKMIGLTTFDEKATRYMVAFGDAFIKVSEDINTASEAYQAFLDVFSYGSEEQLTTITQMVTQIADLSNQIEDFKSRGLSTADLEQRRSDLQQGLAQSFQAMYQQSKWEMNPIPKLLNINQPYQGTAGFAEVFRRAREGEMAFKTSPGLGAAAKTESEVRAARQNFEDFSILIEEGGRVVAYSISELAKKLTGSGEKIDPDWLQKEMEQALITGEIKVSVEAQGAQWGGRVNLPSGQQGLAQQWINYYQNKMAEWGVTDLKTNETQVVQFEDGQWGEWRGDSRAIAAMLGLIQETEQKQLEQGIWNIPEGATFMVPITSLTAANQAQTGGGGGGLPTNVPTSTPIESGGGATGTTTTGFDKDLQAREQRAVAAEGINIPSFLGKYMERQIETLKNNPSLAQRPETSALQVPRSFVERNQQRPSWWEELFTQDRGGGGKGYVGVGGKLTEPSGITEILKSLQTTLANFAVEKGRGIAEALPSLPKINLAVNSTTTLTLDGRILATAMKPYFLADITRAIAALGKNKYTSV